MSIRCHSAFKHYEMFHSRGNDVINIGSNNTTIFNCGGSHLGGFWGGFGLGLGNGFGNLFSGLLGGFGLGFPGMGFGFPSFGNIWGGNGGQRTENEHNCCNCKNDDNDNVPTLNKDRKALHDLIEARRELTDGTTPATNDQKAAFNKKVDDAIAKLEKETDDIDAQDLKDFKLLYFDIEESAEPEDGKGKVEKDPTQVEEPEVQDTEVPAPEVKDNKNEHKYLDGYSNYDGKTELKDGDVIRATDTSGATRDTVIVNGKTSKITKATNGSHPQTIVIQDSKDITYTYSKTVDGEYIYTSNQDNQEYVLQSNGKGKYELVQYEHNKGYGKKDWSPKEN